jgi:hypothetical protein
MPFLKEGEIRHRKKCSEHLKELDRNVGETEVDQTDANPNVTLVTVMSQKQHAVFGKVIICPCYCIVFP